MLLSMILGRRSVTARLLAAITIGAAVVLLTGDALKLNLALVRVRGDLASRVDRNSFDARLLFFDAPRFRISRAALDDLEKLTRVSNTTRQQQAIRNYALSLWISGNAQQAALYFREAPRDFTTWHAGLSCLQAGDGECAYTTLHDGMMLFLRAPRLDTDALTRMRDLILAAAALARAQGHHVDTPDFRPSAQLESDLVYRYWVAQSDGLHHSPAGEWQRSTATISQLYPHLPEVASTLRGLDLINDSHIQNLTHALACRGYSDFAGAVNSRISLPANSSSPTQQVVC